MQRKPKAVNPTSEIPFDPNLSDPPEWLSESQKASWSFAIDRAPKGLLKKIDSALLTIWVVAEDIHREATKQLVLEGLTHKAINGYPMQSPYLSIVNRQATMMIKAAVALGFSPASRSKLDIAPELDPNNPWAKFSETYGIK